jgi:hypothetical protein
MEFSTVVVIHLLDVTSASVCTDITVPSRILLRVVRGTLLKIRITLLRERRRKVVLIEKCIYNRDLLPKGTSDNSLRSKLANILTP